MDRHVLIDEIAGFGYDYGIFSLSVGVNEIKRRIAYILDESEHIESLISAIIIKTKNTNDIDIERVKKILLELEKIRLDLEYNDSNKYHDYSEKSYLTIK